MKYYKIIVKESKEELEEEVNKYLTDGWDLVGGVSISISESDVSYIYYYFAQAMVKK